jgi:ABC-type multidrug transport system ATPase subunit
VRQEDSHLLPALTARETLQYAAELKLPHLSRSECWAKAEEIISELRLVDCANTIVGGSKVKVRQHG